VANQKHFLSKAIKLINTKAFSYIHKDKWQILLVKTFNTVEDA
jgi:hypothetical protein